MGGPPFYSIEERLENGVANPKRKMCTLRKVTSVTPIKGADRIECIHIDGWTVVDQKDVWHEGDICAFFEVDTFLPTNDERYKFLAQFGEKTMSVKGVPTVGHVLKTRRLRKQWSQGLIMKPYDVLPSTIPEYALEKMYEKKARLDGLAGVCEYVPELPANMASNFIGKYDPFVAPRTDAERIQNIDQHIFDLIKRTDYFVSVKVDGTSITMCYDPRVNRYRVFSHNNEFDPEAPGIGATAIECAKELGLYDWLAGHPGITIQAELCGPKINGNTLKLEKHRLFVFSMWDMRNRTYCDPYQIHYSPEYPSRCTPKAKVILGNLDTPNDLLEWVDGLKGSVVNGVLDEGIVVHVMDRGDLTDDEWNELHNVLGDVMQVKAVSNTFLLKKGE